MQTIWSSWRLSDEIDAQCLGGGYYVTLQLGHKLTALARKYFSWGVHKLLRISNVRKSLYAA